MTTTEHQEKSFTAKHERARKKLETWSRRERQKRRFKSETKDQLMARLRVAELERLCNTRYGGCLPDDDAGREDLSIIFHHLARVVPMLVRAACASVVSR